ncbi:MAG: lysine--tRNA ligase [Thermoflexus sp.]|nr:lysine--tRNA ligase [Thermoflexus sp.]
MALFREIVRRRLEKVARLRAQGIDPYPPCPRRTHTSAQAIRMFQAVEGAEDAVEAVVAGRLTAIRVMGKATFADLYDGDGRLQLFLRYDELGEERYRFFQEFFDLGDFIEAEGTMMRTRTGEISLRVRDFRMLAKAIYPPPSRWHGLKDVETRYRRRYLDLMMNPEIREIFRIRAALVRAIRAFLDERGFIEVETPILQPIYGGASARPFITYHNELGQPLYLRISFELYLKRLLVGMFERVYEIGRDFRNEGVSFKHNPEFTQMECYVAYADYHEMMRLTEELIAFAADQVLGRCTLTYQGHKIDLHPPWRRIPLREAILEFAGIDVAQHPTRDALAAAIAARGIEVDPRASRGKLIDDLISRFVEPNLIQPTFVYDYPREISPLAKARPDDPETVERFEGFIGGMEICNAFTELNDPIDQEQRFLEQGRAREAGDEEAHPMDEDYLDAMRYGMPPNGGLGLGIDRLTMLFTDRRSIREVILFPHLRPRERRQEEAELEELTEG